MSQPVLTATFALVIAVILTATIAIIASATETPSRAIKLTVVGAAIALAVVGLQRADLRINFTGSMPIGIYLLSPIPPDGVKRGMLVAACPPTRATEIGRRRGYLASGPCPSGTELLLKVVVAAAGDEVALSGRGVALNGCLLANSRPVPHDAAGRRMLSWPQEHFQLLQGQLWLYADNVRSWDSRYWGPVPVADILATVVPVLTIPRWSRALRLVRGTAVRRQTDASTSSALRGVATCL
jgi:conjugative transfer signal peptidase TraF